MKTLNITGFKNKQLLLLGPCLLAQREVIKSKMINGVSDMDYYLDNAKLYLCFYGYNVKHDAYKNVNTALNRVCINAQLEDDKSINNSKLIRCHSGRGNGLARYVFTRQVLLNIIEEIKDTTDV